MSTEECEQLVSDKRSPTGMRFCGKLAVRRYPASGGGWAYVCLAHARGMEKYCEPCYEGEDDSPLGTPTEGGE